MQDKPAVKRRPPRGTEAGRRADTVPLTRAGHLLTVREVSDLLCVSRQTVYTMIRDGDLPGIRVRRMMRLRPRDVLSYMRHNGMRVQRKLARRAKRRNL